MSSGPLTSVIIPAYNAELYIERTLRSALQQTHRNLEIIVVDDGSTDSTKAIAESVGAEDDRVRIFSVPHGGVARARNFGIENATGEYLAFLDADDLWHPVKIELQVAVLTGEKSNGVAAVYTLSRLIDSDDRTTEDVNRVMFNGYALARHLYAKPVGNGSSMLVRREAALAVGGFDPSYAACGTGGCEDLDFELKIASKYPIAAIRLFLVGYRIHRDSMSTNNRLRMGLGMTATVARHVELHPELPGFAARHARASATQFTLSNLVAARQWKLAARDFFVLFRNDPMSGLEFAFAILKRRVSRLRPVVLLAAPEARTLPLFYDLSPDLARNPTDNRRSSRDKKIIGKLEAVDAVLALRIGLKS